MPDINVPGINVPGIHLKEVVYALPDIAKLLWRVVRDDRVPAWIRGGLVGTAAYLALPFDLIPDWIPLLGQLDDFFVITIGVRTLLRRVPEDIVVGHWDGERDVLRKILGRELRDASGNGS